MALEEIRQPTRTGSAAVPLLFAAVSLAALWGGCEDAASDGAGSCQLAGTPCMCVGGLPGQLACGPTGGPPQCDCSSSTGGGATATTGTSGISTGGVMATTEGDSLDGGIGDPEAGMGNFDAGAGIADAGSDGNGQVGEEAGQGDDGVPDTDYCAEVADWDPVWAQYEEEVLLLTNEVRAQGANCDTEGTFGPADPLTMQAQLRCAARLHSKDMAVNDYFAHQSQDGRQPNERMADAGYQGVAWGENIALNSPSPQEVVDGWVDSDGHCANLMQTGFTQIGVGYYAQPGGSPWGGESKLWTQKFGAQGGMAGGGNFDPCDYVDLPSCP